MEAKYSFAKHGGHVVWFFEGNSGLVTPGGELWAEYQAQQGVSQMLAVEPKRPNIDLHQAMEFIELEFAAVCKQIAEEFSRDDIGYHPLLVGEAKVFLSDSAASTPLLDGLSLPFEDKNKLCRRVIVNAERYETALGGALMWRRIAIVAAEALFAQGGRDNFCVRYPEVPSAS